MSTTPTQQPKALQLADRLKERIRQLNNSWNAKWNRSTEEFDLCAKSEDELRYQHAEIARLTAENEALRARLEAPNPADELVLWTGKSWIDDAKRGRNGTFVNKPFPGFDVPLYTRPQCSKPLTDMEKHAMWVMATIDQCSHEQCYLRGIADSEAAHGIGEQP